MSLLILSVIIVFVMFIIAYLIIVVFDNFSFDLTQSESYYIKSVDGCRLAMHRYCSSRISEKIRVPSVALFHGLGVNGFSFESGTGVSLAKYLSNAGMDVWVCEFRGNGKSNNCGPSSGCNSYTFDDFYIRDLPAFINFISSKSGKKKIHAIGHSIGGLALLAYCANTTQNKISSINLISTPLKIWESENISLLIKLLIHIDKYVSVISVQRFLHAFLIMFPVPKLFLGGVFNTRLLTNRQLRTIVVNHFSPIPITMLRQLALWIDKRGYYSVSNDPIFKLNKHLAQPIQHIVGDRDPIAKTAFIEDFINNMRNSITLHPNGSSLTILNRIKIFYGHGDILCTKNAEQEIFYELARWIRAHHNA